MIWGFAVNDSVMEYTFATVPLFTFMGLIVSKGGIGSDVYEVMSSGFRKAKGMTGLSIEIHTHTGFGISAAAELAAVVAGAELGHSCANGLGERHHRHLPKRDLKCILLQIN